MKTMVCFDLDMTLLDHKDYKIPASAMEALRRLKERHYVVLATGRDMDTYYSRQYKDMLEVDAIIHSNGTKITVGEQLLYESKMPKELTERILRFSEEHGIVIGVTMGDDDYYTHQDKLTEFDVKRWGESGRQYHDPWKLLNLDVRTMAYMGPPEGAKLLEAEFPELKCPMFAGGIGADVLERQCSKAEGLRMLCEYFGVDMKDTYAFGDSMNDIEILQAAAVGVAMGNAVEELKAAADYVTSDIGDDGVYKACKHLGLI